MSLLRRLWQMLLSPEGKDMGHVIIAWGTSLLFSGFVHRCVRNDGGDRKKERGGITTTARRDILAVSGGESDQSGNALSGGRELFYLCYTPFWYS